MGVAVNLQDFAKLLRARWFTVCAATLAAVLGGRHDIDAHDTAVPGLDEVLRFYSCW